MKHKLTMEGLNCAHCAGKIEKAIAETEGFENVSLVFATKTLYAEHKSKDIVPIVQKITDDIEHGVTVINSNENTEKKTNIFKDNLLLFISIIFGVSAIICEAFDVMPLIVALLSTIAIILSGHTIFVESVKSIFKFKINEDTLMAIAVVAAFCLGQYVEGAMVTILFGIGEMFEDLAVNNSRKSIEALANMQADTATLLQDGVETVVEAESVEIGSILVVKPYERIPLDSVVIEGVGTIDTSAITGESMPIECQPGTEVLSGMINGESLIKIKTTKEYKNSTASRIIKLVEEASITKSKNEKLITRFASVYTPIVVAISILVAVVPPLLNLGTFNEWIYKALVCLVSSCPCAIVISIPLSYYSGIGVASKNGVLFKGGKYLEVLASADTIAFDKTGTLTEGNLKVTSIIPFENYSENKILAIGASVEKNSNHPIALAIKNEYNGELLELTDYKEKPGYGVSAIYEGKSLICGNKKLIDEEIDIDANVFLIYDGKLIGAMKVEDNVRSEAKGVLEQIKKQGVKNLVMLTGDNKQTADKIAKQIGINEVHSELLPQDKVETVNSLKAKSKGVCFIGDGINDAPVLTASDCGFAMGLGTDAAIEAADAVLTTGNLTTLPKAIKIAKKTVINVKTILIFALAVKLAVIICAILGYAAIWMSVVADTGVCMLCILYATRLLKMK